MDSQRLIVSGLDFKYHLWEPRGHLARVMKMARARPRSTTTCTLPELDRFLFHLLRVFFQIESEPENCYSGMLFRSSTSGTLAHGLLQSTIVPASDRNRLEQAWPFGFCKETV